MTRSITFAFKVPVLALLISLSLVGISVYLGRDTPWDYFAYHAYAAQTLFGHRFDQDYFGAGMQGFLNPIGFLPFALAQKAQLNSLATGIVLAAVHSLNGIFLLLISRDLVRNRPERLPLLVPGTMVGLICPILLAHIGSTFTDPVGSALVLGAFWLVLTRHTNVAHAVAGVLIGAAIAVKLTNLVFAIALVACAAFPLKETARKWFGRNLLLGLGLLGGLAVFQGYWSFLLYKYTGNPLFPFFNSLFKSPLYATDAAVVGRFVPATFSEAILSPLELAKYNSWSHLEVSAPNFAPVALVLVAALAALSLLARRNWETVSPVRYPDAWKYAIFVVASYVLWLMTSGNSRYAIPLFMALGPAATLLLGTFLPRRYAILAGWLLLLLQAFVTYDAGIKRWNSQQWSKDWVSIDLPAKLAEQPYLFISLAQKSHTELVTRVHPESAFVVLVNGQNSLPSQGPASEGLFRIIRRHAGHIKVVLQRPALIDTRLPDAALISRGNDYLDRLNLRIVEGTCQEANINAALPMDIPINRHLEEALPEELVICDVIASPSRYVAQRQNAERIFDAFEQACPEIFHPLAPQIEKVNDMWVRIYPKYDSAVLILSYEKKYISYAFTGQFQPILVGTPDTWRRDVGKFECKLPYDGKRGFAGFEAEMQRYERK
ncbi:glycosyltransferase family 87 protein [Pseudoxanthomonas beigongshangi]